jgi:outer membrane autotransporter protein
VKGHHATASFLNQGADLLAGQGMVLARERALLPGWQTFGILDGGWSRYGHDSRTDVSGISLLTGASRGVGTGLGPLTLGAFLELGAGHYNSRHSFDNADSVKSDGNTSYYGGGVLARLDFGTSDGFYVEASARAGQAENSFYSGDLRDNFGVAAAYDADSAYYGLHGGLGRVWSLGQNSSLELYGKYLWNRRNGDSVTLSTGDAIRFQATDSQRTRLGIRFSRQASARFLPYAGVAWEHELDSRARAETAGLELETPSHQGNSGIGEFGAVLKPNPAVPLTVDLSVRGYLGQRRGVRGSLKLEYAF